MALLLIVNNCELEQFKPLQQALAAKFDGDKQVWLAARDAFSRF